MQTRPSTPTTPADPTLSAHTTTKTDDAPGEIQTAVDGAGPLLQRDYWAVFEPCSKTPVEVMDYVKSHFCELPPTSIVKFALQGVLEVAAELDIDIVPGQKCKVRVIHVDEQSLTLATLKGHPEAGRITFGAYRNDAGDVIFHIRSRARASSAIRYLGFMAMGEAMQTNTWTDFINCTADGIGAGIRGQIHADTVEVEDRPEDGEPLEAPTFKAVGG